MLLLYFVGFNPIIILVSLQANWLNKLTALFYNKREREGKERQKEGKTNIKQLRIIQVVCEEEGLCVWKELP